MKTILLFVLAGLSVSHGFDCIQRYQAATTLQCLQNALTITPDYLEKLIYFICNYEDGIKNNKKEFEAAFRELIAIMQCASCPLDKLLGTNKSVEDLVADIGGEGQKAVFNILKAADELRLTGTVAHLACGVLKGLGTAGGLVNLGGGLLNIVGGLGGILH
ncbi:ranaspumin-like [Bufo bufo]|uniref:ranaspumin-like n=1 Tax=Bufo bufo TaxID=8384 RepID=UPI001ABE4F11|nr:ranaspumin-like [Bufo bufo]